MFAEKPIVIVSPDGEEQQTKGFVAGSELVVISDVSVHVDIGYEIRRTLPNGRDEVFNVLDVAYYEEGFKGKHYQVKIRKAGSQPHRSGGNYYNASGPNARIVINSTDNSTNVVGDAAVFNKLSEAIKAADMPAADRDLILTKITELEEASKRSSTDYISAFQKFTEVSFKWSAIIGPYLPALTKWLSI